MDYPKYIVEIIGSIIIPLLGIIVPILIAQKNSLKTKKSFREKINRFWATFPLVGKFIIIHRAGIKAIFLHRDDIIRFRKNKEIDEYILTHAKESFTYVGIWFSDIEQYEKIGKTLRFLLEKNSNLTINLYFRDSNLTETDKNWLIDYYNCRNIENKILECIDYWKSWVDRIDEPQTRRRVKLFTHQCNLTCSFFLFNSPLDLSPRQRYGKEIIFFDQKLYACTKQQSIAMEITFHTKRNAFYHTITQMYERVKAKAQYINSNI